MNRVSTDMFNNDMQYHLRRRESELSQTQNRIAEQTRLKELRDDPSGAAHAVRYQSHIVRLQRFSENVTRLRDSHNVAEGYMRQGLDIMQRVREIAIQGANGIYSGEELAFMGQEVDQLLTELVNVANARSGDGTTLFSGDRTRALPFEVVPGRVPGGPGEVATEVVYTGTIHRNMTEISEGKYIEANFPGNEVFWAENQQLFSDADATSYQVQADAVIRIDGTDIQLRAGDNVRAIIHKINESDVSVRARLDPVRSSLVLETTTPHQLWLEDTGGSTVLADLGLVRNDGSPPPRNIVPSARVAGGSAFDMLIHLRDSLYRGDTAEIGGRGIQGIDQALNHMLSRIGELGAKSERLQLTERRLSSEIPDMQQRLSRERDLDLTEAITDLRMLEFAHQTALQTAARVLRPTLLDFLR